MEDEDKTKEQLINELVELRRRITKLETSETRRKGVKRNTVSQEYHPYILTMKNRGLLDLSLVLIITVIFAALNISINFINRLYSFFDAYTSFPIGEPLINVIFLWLVGLLWLTYRRWREAEKKRAELDTIISSISPDILMVVDSDRNIIMCNASVKRMFGYEVDEVIDQKVGFLFLDKGSKPKYWHEIFEIVAKGSSHIGLATGKKKNGETIPLEIITGDLSDCDGVVLLLRDITERKQAEEALKASLKEKEVLLREIHHRVKNNMQLVHSLINLQSRYIRDKMGIEMLKETQNRIKSMTLIHEKLYESKDLANIAFNEYVSDLANVLYGAYGVNRAKIGSEVDIKDVSLGIDLAIPCGLIINELVSNSLKHAFPEGREGKVKVTLCPVDKNQVELVVSDNGVGIPRDLDFRKTDSLGLHLVTILAEDQLEGRIELDRAKGTKFKIKFKVPEQRLD